VVVVVVLEDVELSVELVELVVVLSVLELHPASAERAKIAQRTIAIIFLDFFILILLRLIN
jgi:hypothetical protein